MSQKSYDNTPALYLIPTPIGNLEDITIRTLNILSELEVLFCEDTRIAGQLLNHYNLKCKLIANHLHNEDNNCEKILSYLKNGQSIGLVSDRGTPIISDPGWKLTNTVIENDFNVISLPGPTALIPALTSSGLDAGHFLFYGFLNSKVEKRKKELNSLINVPYTLIFYEAPHRLSKTLEDMLTVLGDRKICIARELTKKFEEIYRGKISELIDKTVSIKGEIVIVVSGNNSEFDYSKISIIEHINLYIADGYNTKEAIKRVAKDRKLPKDIIYKNYHQK